MYWCARSTTTKGDHVSNVRRQRLRVKHFLKWYLCWFLTRCQRLLCTCRRRHAWTKTISWRMTTAASSTSSGGTLPRNDALVVVVAEVAAGSSHWSSRTYAGGRPARRWKAAPISAGGRVHGPGATRPSCPRRHGLEWRPPATNRRRRRAISAVREAACCAVSIAQLHTRDTVWTRSSSSCGCRAPIPIASLSLHLAAVSPLVSFAASRPKGYLWVGFTSQQTTPICFVNRKHLWFNHSDAILPVSLHHAVFCLSPCV